MVNKSVVQEVTDLLSNIRKDFDLLAEGEWDGDRKSAVDSIDAVDKVAELLQIKLELL